MYSILHGSSQEEHINNMSHVLTLIMAERKRMTVAFILAIAVFSIPIAFTYVAPRPYGVQVTDVETDYYYNGLLLVHGYPLNGENHFHHPGTPIQILTAFLIRVIGDGPEHTQTILNAGRIFMGIVIALSFTLFVFLLPKGTPASVTLFMGTIIIIAPPLISQLDYFGVDPFLIAPTLIALTLLWKEISEQKTPREEILVLSGFLFGLASAVKLTAMPVAVSMFLAISIILYPSIRSKHCSWGVVLVFPATAFLSFVFFTLPIFYFYPEFIRYVFSQASATPFFSPTITEDLLFIGFMFPIFSIIGLMSIVIAAILAIQSRPFSPRVIFLFFLLLSFFYFVSKVHAGSDMTETALEMRYILPSYLLIPFCVHYISQERQYRARFIHSGLIMYSFLIFLLAVGGYVAVRTEVMGEKMAVASSLDTILGRYDTDETDNERVALEFRGGSDAGVVKPSAVFHFWGNRKYGDEKFTKKLLASFPNETYFDYGTARGYAGNNPVVQGREIVWGETKGIRPSAFLFPIDMVTMSHFGWPPEELSEFLARNYQDVSMPAETLQFLIQHYQRGVDVLGLLSERYEKSLSVFPMSVAGYTWIFVAETPPPSGEAVSEE